MQCNDRHSKIINENLDMFVEMPLGTIQNYANFKNIWSNRS